MQIPHDRRKFPSLIWIVVLLLLLCVTAFIWFSDRTTSSETRALYASPSLQSINTTIHAYGSLQPKTRFSIMSQVSGTVETIHLRPGDMANAGDVIVTLNNPKLAREAEKAKLDWLTEQANLDKLAAAHQNAIFEHQAKVKLAQLELALAENRLNANKAVYQQQVISRLDLQQTELAYERARLNLSYLEQQQQTLQSSQQAELTAYQYSVQRVRHQYELLQADIENLRIKAGITGVVNTLNTALEEGQSVDAGVGLGQLADPRSLYAQLRVQAREVNQLHTGQTVAVSIKTHTVNGLIQRISPQVENATVEIDVVFLDNLPEGAISNMAVSAVVVSLSKQPSLVLQKPPHIQQAGVHQVLVAKENGHESKTILVGQIDERQIEILSGIEIQDRVLLVDPARWKERI